MANENERPAPIKIGGELEPQTVDYILGTAETIIDDTWDKSESQDSKRQSAINSYLQDEIEDIQAESWGELTPDTIPEYNSGHLITSGGVYTGITAAETFTTGETVPTIGIDTNPTNNSTNLIKSGGVKSAIDSVAFSTNEKVNTVGIDSEPTAGSDNLVKSGGVVDIYGSYTENPEFIYVQTDNEGKILYGVKTDGEFFFGAGCPQQVKDYIEGKISALSLDEYEDIVAFLNDYLGSDTTLKILIDEIDASKVDKVEGKSLIDAEYASSQFTIENPEWISVTTDSEGRVLGGRKTDGTVVENMPIENPTINGKVDKEEGKTLIDEDIANSQFIEHRDENLEMVVDSELRIIDYRDKTGKKHLAFPTNQDDVIQEQVDSIVNHVFPNLSAIVSPQEFNGVKEDKCNNNVAYLLYSNQTNPFGNPQVIKNGRFIKDFSGRSNQAKICLFGDTHFGNTITGTFVLNPTIEERCGTAFVASNSKNADFSLILGDVYEESYDHEINKQIYALYHQKLDLLETPCFQIEGNHDEEMLYKDGTEFVNEITKTGIIQFNNIRIICFNAKIHYRPTPDIEDIGDVSDEVYEWLENAVKDSYNNGYITILANHYELAFDANDSAWDEPIGTHRDDIIQLCGDYDVKLYLNGHEHIPNLIYKTIETNDKILTNIEFGRTALSYSVIEIKDGENSEGFYISEYETLTDDLANTLFVPMELTNANQIIKTTYKELTPLSRN